MLEPCGPPSPCFVTSDPGSEARAFHQFMAVTKTGAAAPSAGPRRGECLAEDPDGGGLEADTLDGKAQVAALARAKLPVYFPQLIVSGTSYEPVTPGEYPRAYRCTIRPARPHAAYRIVVVFNAILGQYYGVQGTTWKRPPILASPQEIRFVGGKRLELYFDGQQAPPRGLAYRAGRVLGLEHA